ncbi:MAG: XTP/dITP diphosphohydrolase [Patescibacteria group bacterium]|nr:XTP/dITP diphosphohydrolase [Patescibacteria group bacterium]
MNKLFFITGNTNKYNEVKAILPNIEQLNIDLPEIQELDAQKIIAEKLLEARKHHEGMFMVEDTSLYINDMNGFPGPLIKWILKAVENEGLVKIATSFGNGAATAKTIIGLLNSQNEIFYFEGTVEGKIVPPSGESGFGWDSIFMPDGYTQTFAKLGNEIKNKISMRKIAVEKLKAYLASER